MDHKIELKNITKQIRKNTVLDNVSCSFSSGEVTGLVGVNGSGKTMLMRIITGLCVPTEGEALIDGRKLHKDISFPSSCGLLLETPAFIDSFTGFENLKMIASIKKKVRPTYVGLTFSLPFVFRALRLFPAERPFL